MPIENSEIINEAVKNAIKTKTDQHFWLGKYFYAVNMYGMIRPIAEHGQDQTKRLETLQSALVRNNQ